MERWARLDARARTGLLMGGLAMFFALDVAFLVSLLPGLVFAPLALGQAIIEVLPGWISIPLIDLLQHWAQRLLVAGVLLLYLIGGAATGLVALDARRRDLAIVGLGALPWLLTVVLGQLFAGAHFETSSVLVDAGAGALTFFAALALMPSATRSGPAEDTAASPSRRRALLGAAALAALAAGGGLAFGPRLRGVRAAGENVRQVARRLRSAETVAAPDARFEAIANLTTRITPTADHYVVDTTLFKPEVDVARWQLEIKGSVEQPFSLGYEELLDLEAVEQLHTLECISNTVGGDLISTALWTGVPLRDLLARAKPRPSTFDVILRSVDDYTDSIPLAKAMESRTLVAYLMNGSTLPVDHGFPARVLVPNIYGMKNVKWLRSIELVDSDYLGYWQQRGWSDSAIVNTNTRIDVPTHNVRWSGGEVTVAGIAFAGSRGVSRIEVSTDGGRSWADAELEPALGELTWRRWAFRWTPPAVGVHRILARATDGTGQLETSVRRDPFPVGATGYDTADLAVTRG